MQIVRTHAGWNSAARRRCRLALLALVIQWCAVASAHAFTVAFINPGRANEPFWSSVATFMSAAADDLGIQLEVLYAERNHLRMLALAKEVAQRPRKPDYVIVVNEKLAAAEMLKTLDAAGIKTLLYHNQLAPEQTAELGEPRQKLRHWLGTIVPSHRDAGYLTGRQLIRAALANKRAGPDGLVRLGVIAGDKSTPASIERLDGLRAAVAESGKAVEVQLVYGNWDQDLAREQMATMLQRNPALDAIWTASDLMAFGAMDSTVAAGRRPGKDLLFSSINNSAEALAAVADGRLSALGAGHFAGGAWALVLLFDHKRGADFATQGTMLTVPMFGLITTDNLAAVKQRLDPKNFRQIDFKSFSRSLGRAATGYDFSFARLIE